MLHPLQPGPTRGEGAEEELELKKEGGSEES